jgi:hypothetical protein|uniref:Uncharacterized protein n=1 Tax=viral metagenome TaxID=1070528 RepID=A0A6C0AM54_9ZZZZ
MIITLSVLFGLMGCVFYYRRYLFLKMVLMVLFFSKYIIGLYFYIKRTRNNSMCKKEYKKLNRYFIEKYHLISNDKDYTIMFMSSDNSKLRNHISDFKDNIKDNLTNRDLIVHCNISSDQDLVIELTDIIRNFCYYFDKDYSLDMFLEYLDNYIIENKPQMQYINIYDYNLCVYLNDSEFTERIFPLKKLTNSGKTFKELLLND